VTQPIQEPLLPRAIAKTVWDTNQLYRRPDPNQAPIIQIFRAAVQAGDTFSVPDATGTIVDWPDWENCGEDGVFSPINTSGTPAGPTDTVRRVVLDFDLFPGRYQFFFGVVPDTDINGVTQLAMHDDDATWGYPDITLHGPWNGGLENGFMMFTLTRTYPIFDPTGGIPSDAADVFFTIAQTGGSSETFGPCIMEIQYESNVLFCETSG
jgi:hypothetical protein